MTSENHKPNEAEAEPAQTGVDTDALLREIIAKQEEQQDMLITIKDNVGCLFAYMVVSIILGVIWALMNA
ncbi:MAG: hypothetical protein JJU29_08345 [Verrucomicrobia bacterium]|nr:hypothetical protein [Verrucomicrobiota bacterium]MCH8512139.1 hypothetical protein [Kiritimatiellia bacterium]